MAATSRSCERTKPRRRLFGFIKIQKVKTRMWKKRRNPVLLFSLVFVSVASWLHAADTAPQAVQVTVRSILASNQSDEFDPKLKNLEQQLKPLKQRSFR